MAGTGERSGRLICPGETVCDSGQGFRFTVKINGIQKPAFVVRYRGKVHGYVNQCVHLDVELDWKEREFFDHEGEFIVCATHGAQYYPDTGQCAGGRCSGGKLFKLDVEELGSNIYLVERNQLHLA